MLMKGYLAKFCAGLLAVVAMLKAYSASLPTPPAWTPLLDPLAMLAGAGAVHGIRRNQPDLPVDPAELAKARALIAKAGVATASTAGAVLLAAVLCGCSTVRQALAPDYGDLSAIQGAAAALPALVQQDEKVYTTAIDALVVTLKKRGHELAADRADYELLAAGAAQDTSGTALPPKYGQDGKQVVADGARVARILATRASEDAAVETVVNDLVAAVAGNKTHADLANVAALLTQYLDLRTPEDQKRAALVEALAGLSKKAVK